MTEETGRGGVQFFSHETVDGGGGDGGCSVSAMRL